MTLALPRRRRGAPRAAVVVGVDPGLKGGISVLTLDGRHVLTAKVPVRKARKGEIIDVTALRSLLGDVMAKYEIRLVGLERQQVMHVPGGAGRKTQGASSAFTLGRNFGRLEATIEAVGLPLEEPFLPRTWQQAVLGKITADKAVALAYVARRFPRVDLRPGRCTKDQDWIGDSICIAEHARRMLAGGSKPGGKRR